MRKYCTVIFLSILFLLAFSHAVVRPVPLGTGENSTTNAAFNANSFHTESAIEHVTTQHSAGIQPQQLQKTSAVYLPASNRIPVISHTVLYASNDLEAKELFDNNYLSYNYPSHNFW